MGIGWKVEFTPLARRHLDELEDRVRIEAIEVMRDLREDPFSPGHIPLRGYRDVYRIRFYRDQYRIIYRVLENGLPRGCRGRMQLLALADPWRRVYWP